MRLGIPRLWRRAGGRRRRAAGAGGHQIGAENQFQRHFAKAIRLDADTAAKPHGGLNQHLPAPGVAGLTAKRKAQLLLNFAAALVHAAAGIPKVQDDGNPDMKRPDIPLMAGNFLPGGRAAQGDFCQGQRTGNGGTIPFHRIAFAPMMNFCTAQDFLHQKASMSRRRSIGYAIAGRTRLLTAAGQSILHGISSFQRGIPYLIPAFRYRCRQSCGPMHHTKWRDPVYFHARRAFYPI